MSELIKLPQKNLRFILKRMKNDIERFGRPNELIGQTNNTVIKNIFEDIGMPLDKNDLEFIFALYRLNPNPESGNLEIPQTHTYEVITKRYANISVREYWKNTVESYFEDEDDVQEFDEWFNTTDWWEGEMIDRDEYDEETSETEIDEINKIS